MNPYRWWNLSRTHICFETDHKPIPVLELLINLPRNPHNDPEIAPDFIYFLNQSTWNCFGLGFGTIFEPDTRFVFGIRFEIGIDTITAAVDKP